MDPVSHIGFEILDVSHLKEKMVCVFSHSKIPQLQMQNILSFLACFLGGNHSADTYLPQWTALLGLSHFLQPAWVCIVAPGDWWVGKRRRNLSPGYSAGPVMDGPLEVLAEVMGHEHKKAWSWMYEDRSEEGGWGPWDRGGRKRISNMCTILRVHLCVFLSINTAS